MLEITYLHVIILPCVFKRVDVTVVLGVFNIKMLCMYAHVHAL